jgi:hypothetical protein
VPDVRAARPERQRRPSLARLKRGFAVGHSRWSLSLRQPSMP